MFKFTVRGRGQFPLTMLKENVCWPAGIEDCKAIVSTFNVQSTVSHDVELETNATYCVKSSWNAVGWNVLPANPR